MGWKMHLTEWIILLKIYFFVNIFKSFVQFVMLQINIESVYKL